MSGVHRQQYPQLVTISEHAQAQWLDRTPAEISLKTAWEQSIDIEAPAADATATRLYPPYDTVIVCKHGTVTTVLNNDGRLDTRGFVDCPDCDKLVDPVFHDECPWCGCDREQTTQPGCITVTRGEI